MDVVKITGRNRYADKAMTRLTVVDDYNRGVLIIEGGYIENRGDKFLIGAKHPEAVDEEGDASYVAYLEGAGLVWKDMYGPEHRFSGVILSAKWSTDEEATAFLDEHGFLKFVPTNQKWVPGVYEIRVEHL